MIVILFVVTLAVDGAVQTRAGHAADLLFNTSSTGGSGRLPRSFSIELLKHHSCLFRVRSLAHCGYSSRIGGDNDIRRDRLQFLRDPSQP